jgi:hemerythrin HHE cation binding domain-containing protein
MRYNIFYQIHKALRFMLYETGIELQRTDFSNSEEANACLKKITEVVELFEQHAHNEDEKVFSALQVYEPSVVDSFEQEHETDLELAGKLKAIVNMFDSLTTDEEKLGLASALRRSYIEFMVFNLQHMAREEDVINNLLWRYYRDEDILAIEHDIVSSQPAEEAAFVVNLMMKALSTQEIVGWLKAVEKSAPDFVFNKLFEAAEKQLSHSRFQQVVEG